MHREITRIISDSSCVQLPVAEPNVAVLVVEFVLVAVMITVVVVATVGKQ